MSRSLLTEGTVVISVGRWQLRALDDDHQHRSTEGLELEPELLLHAPFIARVNNIGVYTVSRVKGWQSRFRSLVGPGNDL